MPLLTQSSAWLLYVVLLWKPKVLTKQVTPGTKERDCSLTYWQQTSLIALSASKSLPKAWHAAGCEGRGWQFDGTVIMPWPLLQGFPQAKDSCLPELEKAIWLQVTSWCRKGAISRRAVRDSRYCHTFSTELVFADGSPSSSTGVVYSMHIFTNIPVRKLECEFLYFECFFIARSLHLPIVTDFCCFVKEEGKAQTMEDVLIKLQSGLDSALKETLLFAWTAVRSDLQRLPHPMSLSKRYWHICEMGFTMTLLGWVSETVEILNGDSVPFRAMPCQTTPLVNKILSSLNIHTLSFKKM